MKIRRINLFAGPGVGKSTWATGLFHSLKMRHRNIEHTGEYVKGWSYQGRTIRRFDQLYIFAKQHQYEYRYLVSGVDEVITDSPTFLPYVYSLLYGSEPLAAPLLDINLSYEKEFPSLAVYLHRGGVPYNPLGRFQDFKAAQGIDNAINYFLEFHKPYTKRIDVWPTDSLSSVSNKIEAILDTSATTV